MTDSLEAIECEEMARRLDASGSYRVLRRLIPRTPVELSTSTTIRQGLFLDTETTGTDYVTDEIIELAMVPFTYSLDGKILEVGTPFSALNEPLRPISPEITALTGITQEIVAGHRIEASAVESFVAPAALIIAHHAAFDRPFVERFWPIFETKAWACSMTQIPWSDEGFDGLKLRYLAMLSGFFYEAHRAVTDCNAAIELLSRVLPRSHRGTFEVLLGAARSPTYRVWAENSPFEQKDVLKKRGYRWSGDVGCPPRCWYVEVAEGDLESEIGFLRGSVLGVHANPPVDRLTALSRFSQRG